MTDRNPAASPNSSSNDMSSTFTDPVAASANRRARDLAYWGPIADDNVSVNGSVNCSAEDTARRAACKRCRAPPSIAASSLRNLATCVLMAWSRPNFAYWSPLNMMPASFNHSSIPAQWISRDIIAVYESNTCVMLFSNIGCQVEPIGGRMSPICTPC